MRQLEAFTLGKKFGHPEANEDSLVVMPHLGYAVIDGVTDRNGTRYDGMLSGQFASRTVKRAVEEFLLAQGQPGKPDLQFQGGEHFVDYLGKAIYAGYVSNNAVAAVEADWKVRGGCTVMAAIVVGDRLEVVAILRREAWHYFAALGRSVEDCDAYSAAMTWQGTQNQLAGTATADASVIQAVEARALAACRAHLPNVPERELLLLIQHGIAHGQGDFQNVTGPVLGYGGIDGFVVPSRYVETRSYALADVETIELFSDGYFKLGSEFGVASWEAAFAEVEAEDVHKIGRYMSTKGTTATQLTDDRSYLGVRL